MIAKELSVAAMRPAVLSILSQGESYGYEIIKTVKERSQEALEWEEGVLYPVLHRLERDGLISSHWKRGENGRRRKYYALNAEGSRALSESMAQWATVTQLLDGLGGRQACLT